MNIFRCKDCKKQSLENEIILTIDSQGEWVLHCPKCNSDMLELVNEITRRYDNDKQQTQRNK